MTHKFDRAHLHHEWFPRLDRLLSSVPFAKNRYRVQQIHICAIVLTQDEVEIRHLNEQMPFFSVTQDALDWQPEDDESDAAILEHLMRMTVSNDYHIASPVTYLMDNVKSPEFSPDLHPELDHAYHRQSFRLSSLEVYNGDCQSRGYHIGATALQKLTEIEMWHGWLFKYIRDLDESPRILWAHEGVRTAVLWQAQLDIIDSTSRRPPPRGRLRRRRYGPLSEVYSGASATTTTAAALGRKQKEHVGEGEDSPGVKRLRGVRWRPERKKFAAEMRLSKETKKRNKVWFGDYPLKEQAARAMDVVFYHYGKPEKFNLEDSAVILKTQPSLVGLHEEEKLIRVKEQAKLVAMQAPSRTAGEISKGAAEIPGAAPSRHPPATPHLIFSSPSPSVTFESSPVRDGSGDEGSAETSENIAPDHVEMDVLNESPGLFGSPMTQNVLQYFCSVGTDPSDLFPSSSASSTTLSQFDSFQDDDADYRIQESLHIWNF